MERADQTADGSQPQNQGAQTHPTRTKRQDKQAATEGLSLGPSHAALLQTSELPPTLPIASITLTRIQTGGYVQRHGQAGNANNIAPTALPFRNALVGYRYHTMVPYPCTFSLSLKMVVNNQRVRGLNAFCSAAWSTLLCFPVIFQKRCRDGADADECRDDGGRAAFQHKRVREDSALEGGTRSPLHPSAPWQPPPRWTREFSTSKQAWYFYEKATKRSLWADDSLPPGWAKELVEGVIWYENLFSTTRQKVLPHADQPLGGGCGAAAAAAGCSRDGCGKADDAVGSAEPEAVPGFRGGVSGAVGGGGAGSSADTGSLTPLQRAARDELLKIVGAGYPPGPPSPQYHHGWFYPPHKTVLAELLTKDTQCVVELGSWLGKSTLFIAERAPNAVIVCIDLWDNEFIKGPQGDHYLKNPLQVRQRQVRLVACLPCLAALAAWLACLLPCLHACLLPWCSCLFTG